MPMPAAALHQAPTAALIALTEMPRRLFRSFVNYFRSWNPRAKCFPMVYLDSSDDNALVVYTPSSLRPGPATPATARARGCRGPVRTGGSSKDKGGSEL